MTSSATVPRRDLTDILVGRLRQTAATPLLADVEGSVLFLPDRGTPATVELHQGRFVPRRGRPVLPPTTTVRGRAEVLAAVVDGSDSGLRGFLEHDITIRGDLALAMALDGLFAPSQTPARWPHADLVVANGVPTAYLDAGPRDGRPVLMLHGLAATNASLLPILWDLAADCRVVAPDLPGFGASAAPKAAYSPAYYVPWAMELCRQLDLRDPVVVGNSMGGRIAAEIALERPRSVSGLVGLCMSPAFRRLRQFVPFVKLLRPELSRVPLKVPHRFVVQAIHAMFAHPDRLPDAWYDAAADEFIRIFADPAHRIAFFAATRQIYLDEAFGLTGFWDRLPALEPPALFLWGDTDRLVPKGFARHVEAALPSATSVVLESCGHVPQFEQPEETGRLVRAFLETL